MHQVHNFPSHSFKIHVDIIPSLPRSSICTFSFRVFHNSVCVYVLFESNAWPCVYPWLDHPNYSWRRVHILCLKNLLQNVKLFRLSFCVPFNIILTSVPVFWFISYSLIHPIYSVFAKSGVSHCWIPSFTQSDVYMLINSSALWEIAATTLVLGA